jgi:hypothetical protein
MLGPLHAKSLGVHRSSTPSSLFRAAIPLTTSRHLNQFNARLGIEGLSNLPSHEHPNVIPTGPERDHRLITRFNRFQRRHHLAGRAS